MDDEQRIRLFQAVADRTTAGLEPPTLHGKELNDGEYLEEMKRIYAAEGYEAIYIVDAKDIRDENPSLAIRGNSRFFTIVLRENSRPLGSVFLTKAGDSRFHTIVSNESGAPVVLPNRKVTDLQNEREEIKNKDVTTVGDDEVMQIVTLQDNQETIFLSFKLKRRGNYLLIAMKQ